MAPGQGTTGLGVSIVNAPAADPNAVVKPIGPDKTVEPAAESAAPAPDQINDIRPGTAVPAQATASNGKKKKAPKADLGDESSSKKKKKKGLGKINPF
jgi:outer membrane protein assembly factor BamD